jgi:hypothetical protein
VAVDVGFHIHILRGAGKFAAVQEAEVLAAEEVECSPVERILVAQTAVDAHIGFARMRFGWEVETLPGGIGCGRIGPGGEAARWLEGMHLDYKFLAATEEAGVWTSGHMGQALIVVVGSRSLHCEQTKGGLIVDVLIAGGLTEVEVSLGLGTGLQSLWLGILLKENSTNCMKLIATVEVCWS